LKPYKCSKEYDLKKVEEHSTDTHSGTGYARRGWLFHKNKTIFTEESHVHRMTPGKADS
jgi:hypothetical protein